MLNKIGKADITKSDLPGWYKVQSETEKRNTMMLIHILEYAPVLRDMMGHHALIKLQLYLTMEMNLVTMSQLPLHHFTSRLQDWLLEKGQFKI